MAILVPSLYRGDATGHDALGMRSALRARGLEAAIFAETSEPSLDAGDLSAARAFLARGPALTIFHQATQWDHGMALLRAARGALVVRDHNVTPPGFFSGLSEDFVRASVVGIRQRERFARDPGVALYLAASATNAAELVALGAQRSHVAVVPPFHRAEELAALPPDEPALRRWSIGPATALFVGRLAPNKGHRRAMRVAAAYGELYGEPLRLRFVGFHDSRWARWIEVLARDRTRLGLDGRVELLGTLSEAELKSAYLTSNVFLCCSEHEGFCVPLVEASLLGVPVVAVAQLAVAETLGPSGLVLQETSDDLMAAAVRRVLRDGALREAVIAAQRRNFAKRFSEEGTRLAFLAAVEPLCAELGC